MIVPVCDNKYVQASITHNTESIGYPVTVQNFTFSMISNSVLNPDAKEFSPVCHMNKKAKMDESLPQVHDSREQMDISDNDDTIVSNEVSVHNVEENTNDSLNITNCNNEEQDNDKWVSWADDEFGGAESFNDSMTDDQTKITNKDAVIIMREMKIAVMQHYLNMVDIHCPGAMFPCASKIPDTWPTHGFSSFGCIE